MNSARLQRRAAENLSVEAYDLGVRLLMVLIYPSAPIAYYIQAVSRFTRLVRDIDGKILIRVELSPEAVASEYD